MFHDLDATLSAMLGDAAAPEELRNAHVSFESPDRSYSPAQKTVNLFLHEVAEDRALRDDSRMLERVDNVYRTRSPLLRVSCIYLATAWSAETAALKAREEHRLLGLALLWLAKFPVIEDRFLQGGLAGQPYPLSTVVARTAEGQSMGHFWSALGIAPRPAFSVSVTIAMTLAQPEEQFRAVEGFRLESMSAERPVLAGRVLDQALAPVAGASVTVVERGTRVVSDARGLFTVADLDFGGYTLRVQAAGHTQDVPVVYAKDSQVHNVVLA
ncbi:Carboxypeptidase regulatory-like domain-containing protein [Amycolatopsis xylanica]|uniref:Carboxypeptidase regulatory-like domain-containing protein n=1 Tax=Amycolatopsis xylanica TaxID=589385 RepID=A0A1H2U8M3_9PSEU|nr:Pvc16 family protein [Amycolatopsis xylanica]SDW52228.1 Carboxypeptidase regulatory-like domain-containing protein [Amycolatopsis xylanica]